jgi:hypothetical protein
VEDAARKGSKWWRGVYCKWQTFPTDTQVVGVITLFGQVITPPSTSWCIHRESNPGHLLGRRCILHKILRLCVLWYVATHFEMFTFYQPFFGPSTTLIGLGEGKKKCPRLAGVRADWQCWLGSDWRRQNWRRQVDVDNLTSTTWRRQLDVSKLTSANWRRIFYEFSAKTVKNIFLSKILSV